MKGFWGSAGGFKILVNIYPPFFFAGIKVEKVSRDFKYIEVRLKLRWYNKNYVGTQFGGSLFSMTDPFYMIMLIKNLGNNYIVWDKKSCIKFIKPGIGDVFAEFNITDETLENIKREVDKNGKAEYPFTVEIKDKSGQLIALVEKVEYIKKK